MNTFQALLFGLIQGFAEMLPISSSGHLVLLPYLFKFPDPGLAFDVALHFGTLTAILGYFWKDWLNILGSLPKLVRERKVSSKEQKLAILLLVASIPAAIFGFLLGGYVETVFRNPLLVAAALITMGIIIWIADHRDFGKKALNDLSYKNSFLIGLAQAVALIPGVSRSGVTITAGLFSGMSREDAARFSFLMSAPVIAGATLLKFGEIGTLFNSVNFWVAYVSATISSILAIALLLKFVRKYHFDIFVYYRFALAAIVILVYLTRR
jgi:undecaprenyl-diphosphatase